MSICPIGLQISLNQFSKANTRVLELTVLTYVYTVKTKGWIKEDDINGIPKIYAVSEDWVKER
jgi:hypothetical protein